MALSPGKGPLAPRGGGEVVSTVLGPLEDVLTSPGLNFQPLELTVSGGCTNFVCD